jgi:aldose sugar dehydrogenase
MTHTRIPLALCALLLVACGRPTEAVKEMPQSSVSTSSLAESSSPASTSDRPEVVADNLQIPWSIAFLPTGDLLVTERPGTLLRIGQDQKRYPIEGVLHRGEGGLLGLALHPEFEDNSWLYLYLTAETPQGVQNRVERYTFANDTLSNRTVILEGIPGSQFHDGGRIAFGPDGFLYITTGDAGNENAAQDQTSLAGKILRVADDGSIPADAPYNNAVYSYGHRNAQGLVWTEAGQLWSTEHGRSGVASGYDELNRIDAGVNYGWPSIQGAETGNNMASPILHSGANDTWAPASAAYYDGSIFFGGLRGEALYEARINEEPVRLIEHYKGMYGRIREVAIGPEGYLYFSTSNRDGRGSVNAGDDKILRVDPKSFR